MRSTEGDRQEKRFVVFLFYKRNGFLSEQVSQITLRINRFIIFEEIVSSSSAIMRNIIGRSIKETKKIFKSVFRGPMLREKAQMPFSNECCFVTYGLHERGY